MDRWKEMTVPQIQAVITATPGITTPDFARLMDTSITIGRWLALEVGGEFYEGNHIRLKAED